MNFDQLKDSYKKMHYGVGNFGDEKNPDYRRFKVYPAYPWKDDGTDHLDDNAWFFFQSAEKAGLVEHVRKADEAKSDEPLLTYTEWVKLHQNKPGWVNNLEDFGKPKK